MHAELFGNPLDRRALLPALPDLLIACLSPLIPQRQLRGRLLLYFIACDRRRGCRLLSALSGGCLQGSILRLEKAFDHFRQVLYQMPPIRNLDGVRSALFRPFRIRRRTISRNDFHARVLLEPVS